MENKGKVREHGITLVALVITIIILLILAGVAITALTQTGIIGYAKKAKDNMKNAQIEENVILGSYENKIDEISGEISGSRDNISESEELKKQKTMSETEHFTGEYYLDNKPIYAKTMYIESLPNNKMETYNNNISNVDKIWIDNSKCFVIWNESGNVGTLPFVNVYDSKYLIEIFTSKTAVAIATGDDRSTASAYVTLNYTKTTD